MTSSAVTTDESSLAQPLHYATATPRPARGWAGSAILFRGICLVGVGGCFLIGVLGVVSPQSFGAAFFSGTLTPAQLGLTIVLYILAFASFAGASILIFLGTRALLRQLG